MEKRDRIAGGFYGLLIGDALGVPYEFYKADQLPAYEEIDMTPPAGFKKTYPQVDAGTWSDDGAQALCLLDRKGDFITNADIFAMTQLGEPGLAERYHGYRENYLKSGKKRKNRKRYRRER